MNPRLRRLFAAVVGKGGGATFWYLAGGVASANCLGAYLARGSADYATARTDLTGNGNTLLETNGTVAWDTTYGFRLTAAEAKAFNTQISPANQNYTYLVWYAGATGDGWLFGQDGGGSGPRFVGIQPTRFGTRVRYWNSSTLADKTPQLAGGILTIAGTKCYRNAVDEGLTIVAWTGSSVFSVALGASHSATSTYTDYITADIYAFAVYNAVLTQPQISAIGDALLGG